MRSHWFQHQLSQWTKSALTSTTSNISFYSPEGLWMHKVICGNILTRSFLQTKSIFSSMERFQRFTPVVHLRKVASVSRTAASTPSTAQSFPHILEYLPASISLKSTAKLTTRCQAMLQSEFLAAQAWMPPAWWLAQSSKTRSGLRCTGTKATRASRWQTLRQESLKQAANLLVVISIVQ